MSFLEKVGLKKHDKSADLPPPPPSNKKTEMKPPQAPPKAPDTNISDLPSRSSLPELPQELPKMDAKQSTPPPSNPNQNMQPPPLTSNSKQQTPSQAHPPKQEAQGPPQQPPAKKNPSREELRQAFNDVPPIKSAPKTPQTHIDDNVADNFNVDNMVLPEEDQDESAPPQPVPSPQPAPRSAPSPQTQDSSPDLYISVEKYDDIQHRISDLKKQVSDAGSSIDHILDERKKEDSEFSDFIKDLERIQEDLISIDEDLFTKQ